MTVTVNGREMELEEGTRLSGLIDALGLSDRRVAVELNRVIVQRDAYGASVLKGGDTLEILSFVGGG